MPAISCPIPDCGYSTDNVEAIVAAAQLNIHALIHRQDGSGSGSTKQKPPNIGEIHYHKGKQKKWSKQIELER